MLIRYLQGMDSRFQSTLPYRERQRDPGQRLYGAGFQSTLPYRERRRIWINIGQYTCFNPRSHIGSDNGKYMKTNGTILFQSTLPYRERPNQRLMNQTLFGFNPRSHIGSDCAHLARHIAIILFQSTLPYRERHNLFKITAKHVPVSIHAPI